MVYELYLDMLCCVQIILFFLVGVISINAQNFSSGLPISSSAYDLILHHEVSSRPFYDAVYTKPTVPGADSGVTIGIGYDLGYKDILTFTRDWGSVLSREDFLALAKCIGLVRDRARFILPSVKHITIPWDKADFVLRTYSLPDACQETLKAFPGADRLPPDAFGALVSLVYNRGGATKDRAGSNRRAEMLDIKVAIEIGDFSAIPGKIRAMKRLWGKNLGGLLRRREDEARLVEAALGKNPGYAVTFDRASKDLRAIPPISGQSYAQAVLVRPAMPVTDADAEELRSYFFYNAGVVANSLKERITAVGRRNVCVLQVSSKDDMLWVSEFEDLVQSDEKGGRVFVDKKLGKYVKVDITDLDFDEYPPSEVAKVLFLTQSLLKTNIPSPLLAQWAPTNNPASLTAVISNSVK